ncbi:Tol-Pal system protein TolB [Helicobacter brantae]|uniref:Tol-Pal system protein TolB n=1 Tax=Helicobacter brantae TaxID=375927 RepID=A0A3D8J1U5_9HELI|nr:Tol-Pal system protein TolB [Helicobacter brantae]RDU71176.1 Tol-Pal system protein TolB [Helicobacter brantae]
MFRVCFVFLFSFGLIFATDAKLEIIKSKQQMPTIMVNISGNNLNQKIASLTAKDLEVSGNFKVLSQNKSDDDPSFVFYQSQKVDLLVQINAKNQQYTLKLFDINSKEKVLEKIFLLEDNAQYPFVSHRIANAINQYLKAPSIAWMNRKVVFSKLIAPSKSEIVIADYTLTYQKSIINDGLNIFPKWANAEQSSIFFTKYLDRPTILKYDLRSKKFERILSSQGVAIVSDVSNDFKKILVSMSPIAQADVYLYDLEAKNTKRLTTYQGIDVGANFIEDKNKIIFISDRLGYPNVFLMNEDGSGVEQAVFHGRNNSSASSNGEYVVYSSREEKNEFGTSVFNLYLIALGTTEIRRLTINGANQMPRFSKDGENIMFLKNTQYESALGIVRLRYNKSYLFPITKMKIQSFDW